MVRELSYLDGDGETLRNEEIRLEAFELAAEVVGDVLDAEAAFVEHIEHLVVELEPVVEALAEGVLLAGWVVVALDVVLLEAEGVEVGLEVFEVGGVLEELGELA